MTPSVQEHYGATDIVARILAAVPWTHDDGAALTARQVFPLTNCTVENCLRRKNTLQD
jgi:hypothetical protein